MKKLLLAICIILLCTGLANADLIVRGTDSLGNKLIYDTGRDITWYDYTTSWDGIWDNRVAWAGKLSISYDGGTLDDWRLPTTVDGQNVYGVDGTTTHGYNITSSEMGHLYYEELGNLAKFDTSGNPQSEYGLNNTGDFDNLVASVYWSGTEYAFGNPDSPYAWLFGMGRGYQAIGLTTYDDFCALAVMDGDVAAVPIPGGIYLLGTGLIGLVSLVRRKQGNRR